MQFLATARALVRSPNRRWAKPAGGRTPDLPPAGTVLIVCPGGLEHGGGIGRQMGYFLRTPPSQAPRPTYYVIDSRGPWFLGASPAHTLLAVGYLVRAVLQLLGRYLTNTRCIAHINITGRGSTVRKLVLVAVARCIGLGYLLHLHDADYAAELRRHSPLVRSLIATMFRRAAKILVLGERDRQLLLEALQLAEGQVTILHNAVPDPQPAPPVPPQPGRACHLLFLGHLSERKGVPELLQALALPSLVSQSWRATLAGGGPIEEYRNLAVKLGISGRVAFPGWVDATQVRSLFADADILVLPSHAEGLAMAVLEGLAHGIAVVTTPVGAHTEVIEPEVSGIFVPPRDVDALATALSRLISDAELRHRLGAGARRRYVERFDVLAYAERLRCIHVDLLAKPHAVGLAAAPQASLTSRR